MHSTVFINRKVRNYTSMDEIINLDCGSLVFSRVYKIATTNKLETLTTVKNNDLKQISLVIVLILRYIKMI